MADIVREIIKANFPKFINDYDIYTEHKYLVEPATEIATGEIVVGSMSIQIRALYTLIMNNINSESGRMLVDIFWILLRRSLDQIPGKNIIGREVAVRRNFEIVILPDPE